MFYNLRFNLFYCNFTESCHKAYLHLNGDHAILTECFSVDDRVK